VIIRRGYSVPERLALLGLGAAAVATVYPAWHRTTGLGLLPCPLRTLTGIPCPVCGMTTAAIALAAGDARGAGAANPFIFVLVTVIAITLPLVAGRSIGAVSSPTPWSPAARRRTRQVAGVLAVVSWVWQLHRFGWA
jgi:hypothetical protein